MANHSLPPKWTWTGFRGTRRISGENGCGELEMKLGGIALGDGWISPKDFVNAWGPLLGSVSRLDNNGVQLVNRLWEGIKKQIGEEKFTEATESWIPIWILCR
ncbi:Serine carboxypeptidase-like 51 [Linum grandiflorum]